MDVSAVKNLNSAATNSTGQKILGKDDFLKLLVAQLSHQDPLNPADSKEFTTQLTQFSTLEEITNMSSTLGDILSFQKSQQNAIIPGLIGKVVRISGNSAYLTDKADLNYSLSRDASSVTITIFDKSGNRVFSKNAGAQAAGDNSYVWDGKGPSGSQMPEGAYTFEIEAQDASGKSVDVSSNSSGVVTGVSFENNLTYLILDGYNKINLSEIKSIEERRN